MNKSKVDEIIEDTIHNRTPSGYAKGLTAAIIRPLKEKLKSAIRQELQDVAKRVIKLARKCKSGTVLVGENIHLYTPEQILVELNLSDKEQKE